MRGGPAICRSILTRSAMCGVAQGDLSGALQAYDEGLGIFRDLAARGP